MSVIVTKFHGPSNHSKASIFEFLKPGCDVTHPRAPASSGWKKMSLRSDIGPPHYYLSNAPLLVSVRATKRSMSHNALSSCRCTSQIAGDVTPPPPPDFRMIQIQDNCFDVRFGMYSPVAFQRAIARLCTSNKTPNVKKRPFLV